MKWQIVDYNIGAGYDENSGKFIAPIDGLYYFYTQVRSQGDDHANLYLCINDLEKSHIYRNEDDGYDTLTLTSQSGFLYVKI